MSIFFGNNEVEEEVEKDDKQESDFVGKLLVAGVALLFLPAFFLGWVVYYYLMLRKFKQRKSVIFSTITIVNILALAVFFLTDSPSKILYVFSSLTTIRQDWSMLIPPLLILLILIGGLIGSVLVWWEIREMKRSPYNLQNEDHWMYNFKFAKTPLEIMRKRKTVARLKTGYYIDEKKVPIGLNEEDDQVAYRFYNEANKHTLMTGGTGAGKTQTMQSLIYGDIVLGTPTFIIDMKRSPEFATRVAKWSKENGSTFYHFVNGNAETYDIDGSEGQSFYDPIGSGSASSTADMLLSMREYDSASAVYKANMQQLLQVVTGMIKYADKESPHLKREVYRVLRDNNGKKIPKERQESFNVRDLTDKYLSQPDTQQLIATIKQRAGSKEKNPIVILEKVKVIEKVVEDIIPWGQGGIAVIEAAVSEEGLGALAKACEYTQVHKAALHIWQSSMGKTQIAHAIEELRGQLRTLTSSEYGEWLKLPEDGSGHKIDLYELSQQPNTVVMFSINSDSEPEFAKLIGTLIMQDLTVTSARRRNKQLKNQINVYVDEFQTLNMSSVNGLLQKSRESRMAMTLSLQSLDQIVASADSNGEAHLGDMLDTCSNFIVHAGSKRSSAERFSDLLGTQEVEVYSTTNKHSGKILSFNYFNKRDIIVNKKKEEKAVIEPGEFMKLSSPDENNDFKATAIYINKTCSDPRYATKEGGGLARKVHLVLPEKLLEDCYIPPSFIEDGEPKIKPVAIEENASFGVEVEPEDEFTNFGFDGLEEDVEPVQAQPSMIEPDYSFDEPEIIEPENLTFDTEDDGDFTFEEEPDIDEDLPSLDQQVSMPSRSFEDIKKRASTSFDNKKSNTPAFQKPRERKPQRKNDGGSEIVMPDLGL